MIRVTVTDLAAFAVCERKPALLKIASKEGVQMQADRTPRQQGTLVHAVLERKSKQDNQAK